MKKILLTVLTVALAVSVLSGCNDSSEKTSATQDSTKSSSASAANPTQEATQGEFDVTAAYANKPYSNDFALERVEQLQYLDDSSLYKLCSLEPSPVFYDGFYRDGGSFDVNIEGKYSYDKDSETVRKYCDTYEYSRLANTGAVKVIDSFVYNDSTTNRILYYCFYTVTHWSEKDDKCDTLDYYRDVITINKDNTISVDSKIAMKTSLEIPKEITGNHDFYNVI